MRAVDTAAFQRLRYVRQLGHAFLVYPGATHTRFEHALGAYHLARRALATLQERGDLGGLNETDCLAIRLAALLHDIGHYPFSHALEEAGFPSHEMLGARRLREGALGELLRSLGGDDLIARIAALIQGTSRSPLGGLVSGSLDLDKIDYLSRDARMCGVPYGVVDVDRLLASLTLVELPGRNARDRRAGKGRQRARIAAVREVPDVPQRVLAPRRAIGHVHVQARRPRPRSPPGTLGSRRSRTRPMARWTRCCSSAIPPGWRGRCASAGCTSGRSTCRRATCPTTCPPGCGRTPIDWSASRMRSRRTSGWRPAEC